MAVEADVLASVKSELDIDGTTFDTDLADKIDRSVKRLFPYVQSEVKETLAIDNDTWRFTLPASMESIRFMYDADDDKIEDFLQHGREIIVRDYGLNAGDLTIYGNGRFTLATLPDEYVEAVILYSCSLFYSQLAGNRRKYNQYMQNGKGDVQVMREQANWYEERANTFLQDRGVLLGYE